MAQYKFAEHENNVLIRDWCNANRGRSSSLSEYLFPNNLHPKAGLGKYKCGEQFIDDDMLAKAKPFMAEIESLEKAGKRKVHKTKLKGCSLETNKNENYAEIETTQEYKDYVEFHHKYFIHSKLFREQLAFELPSTPGASNLMSKKFAQKLNKAKQLVISLKLPPCTDKRTYKAAKNKNLRISKIREASANLIKTKYRYMTQREEFDSIVDDINEDEKLSKLVPVILMMNFSSTQDFDQVDTIYERFTNKNSLFSVIKLVNIKAAHRKGLEMIADGWLDAS